MNLPATNQIQERFSVLFKTFDINAPGGFVIQPTILQAGLIVFLIFLLILTLGSLRHRMNEWTLKGAMPGVSFGFALALIIEGLFLIGGRTLFTEIIGWKDAPKPISNVLDASREKLVDVLGTQSEVPQSQARSASPEQVVLDYRSLTEKEAASIKELICK